MIVTTPPSEVEEKETRGRRSESLSGGGFREEFVGDSSDSPSELEDNSIQAQLRGPKFG